ncbi:hypothetical protein F4859DRAFT_409707 [Xylaria cf. heliscus]|nr:hypothetical protein F4859DRAFT_409707 [Xylaria cf. heliscus]
MRTPLLTTLAALTASTVSSPVRAREVYATWSATDVTTPVAHVLVGAKFNLTAPAGYIANAPAFDVTCGVSIVDDPPIVLCAFNHERAPGSTVEAAWNINDAPVTVYHTFGSTKAWGSSRLLSYDADFTIDVTNVGSV